MKRKSVLLLAIVLCFTLLACACGSGAQADTGGQNAAAEAGVYEIPSSITVGLMTGFQPYCYQNDDGSVDGYDVEVIKTAAERLGIELDFLVVPWESLLTSLDADKCQIVSSQLWRTEERLERYVMATVPYFEIGGQLLVKADNEDITSLDTLVGQEIGTTVGDAWTTFLEEYNEQNDDVLNIKYYSEDISTVIQDVATGRTAATLNETVVMLSKIEALGLEDEVKIVGGLEGAGCCYTAFQMSDDGRALRDVFDEVYLEMIGDGTIASICEKWFGADLTGNLMDNIAAE